MKKLKLVIISIGLVALLFTSCTKEGAVDLSDVPETYGTQKIPYVPVNKDYIIGCFYNNFTSWPATVKRVPVVLPYFNDNKGGSNDLNNCFGTTVWKGVPVNVMQKQIEMAKGAVDFWTFQYRSLTDTSTKAGSVRNNNKSDTALIKSFLVAPNAGDMKFAIRYEYNFTLFGFASNATPAGLTPATALDGATKANYLKFLLKDFVGLGKFFRFNNYMKTGNKYVVYFHNAHNLWINSPANVFSRLRDTIRYTYGVELYLIASTNPNGDSPGFPPAKFIDYFRSTSNGHEDGFDAVYLERPGGGLSQTVGWSVFWLFPGYLDTYYKYCANYFAPYHLNYQSSLMAAYDPRIKNVTTQSPFFARTDTATFHTLCNVAKLDADTTRIINIDTWNTWDEDSQLEPSLSEGSLYLNMVRREFKKPSGN
jgi:hypothetical protein